jgi:hypothetical protein
MASIPLPVELFCSSTSVPFARGCHPYAKHKECMAELQETFLVKVKSLLSPHLLDFLQIGSVLL